MNPGHPSEPTLSRRFHRYMGKSQLDIRELIGMAGRLRQYAHATTLPEYRDKLLLAAAEIDDQVRLQITLAPEDWPSPAQIHHLHKPVDIVV